MSNRGGIYEGPSGQKLYGDGREVNPLRALGGQEETSTAKEVMPNESRNELPMQRVPKLHQSEAAGDASVKTRAGDASGGGERAEPKFATTGSAQRCQEFWEFHGQVVQCELIDYHGGNHVGTASVPPAAQPALCPECGHPKKGDGHGGCAVEGCKCDYSIPIKRSVSQPLGMTAEQWRDADENGCIDVIWFRNHKPDLWRLWNEFPAALNTNRDWLMFAEAYAREVLREREAALHKLKLELAKRTT